MSFQTSSRDITLDNDGHTLRAYCLTPGGDYKPSSIDLNNYIGNSDGKKTLCNPLGAISINN